MNRGWFKDWAKMEQITLQYFSHLFRSQDSTSDFDFEKVLQVLDWRLSDEDREMLEALLTLEEITEAVKGLGKNRAPGPDDIPADFYIMFWHHLGPLLLEVLNAGIGERRFSAQFLKGLIILLHKKGAQTKLTNKRGITLMNVLYKVGTKAYQLRLTKILVKMVSTQQFAYL